MNAQERIAAGRVKHGVGGSENFPGNVCHLVSPIVGFLRLRQRDGQVIPDMGWMIDRLSLVLDMARQEAAGRDAALARVEALAGEWERRAGMQSEAWRVFGPQTVSVPHAVESIRSALHPDPSQESA